MLERVIENRLKLRCRQYGLTCLKFVSPSFSGVPDRMILIPRGRVVFVELKAPKKVERARQVYVQDQLRRLGFLVLSSVDSFEKVEEVIEECLRMKD